MKGSAFCPAHVTGFFKAAISERGAASSGSTGAGFSIEGGVRTYVEARPAPCASCEVSTSGHAAGDTAVSERVIARMTAGLVPLRVRAHHEIGVPVGCGLGCSAAAALSLALALNEALGAGLSREEAGRVAHEAEVECRTGLGDVLGALDGGLEIRTHAGAPGVGRVQRSDSDLGVIIACFAPVPTRRMLGGARAPVNGLGGRMVEELRAARSFDAFQEMSVRFARYVGAITPRMDALMAELRRAGIGCGVAMFGETVFAMARPGRLGEARRIMRRCGAQLVESRIDNAGARLE